MAESDDGDPTSTVTDSYGVDIPADVRDRLDVRPGDEVRWTVEGGELRLEVVHERDGTLSGLDPVDMGETNAVADADGLSSGESNS